MPKFYWWMTKKEWSVPIILMPGVLTLIWKPALFSRGRYDYKFKRYFEEMAGIRRALWRNAAVAAMVYGIVKSFIKLISPSL